jgi:hypothetical protein
VVNIAIANLSGGFGSGIYNPASTFSALSQDLAVVSGDGPFFQQPRYYFSGFFGIPAGDFGP